MSKAIQSHIGRLYLLTTYISLVDEMEDENDPRQFSLEWRLKYYHFWMQHWHRRLNCGRGSGMDRALANIDRNLGGTNV